jgi:hypothetical protein
MINDTLDQPLNESALEPESPEESPSLRFRRLEFQVSLAAARIGLRSHGIPESPELEAKALSIAQAVDEAFYTSPREPLRSQHLL